MIINYPSIHYHILVVKVSLGYFETSVTFYPVSHFSENSGSSPLHVNIKEFLTVLFTS
jgi:hypothetical protein